MDLDEKHLRPFDEMMPTERREAATAFVEFWKHCRAAAARRFEQLEASQHQEREQSASTRKWIETRIAEFNAEAALTGQEPIEVNL